MNSKTVNTKYKLRYPFILQSAIPNEVKEHNTWKTIAFISLAKEQDLTCAQMYNNVGSMMCGSMMLTII